MIDEGIKFTAKCMFYVVINILAILSLPIWAIPYGVWFHFDEKKRLKK